MVKARFSYDLPPRVRFSHSSSPSRPPRFTPSLVAVALAGMLQLAAYTAGAVDAVGRLPGGFSVSDTGSASYSIPIEVPPGRNGMAPNLALVYNSGGSGGLAGHGWNVAGISAIERCRKTVDQDGEAAPVRFTSEDAYCLDGARLNLIAGAYGADGSEYRTEIDSFVRVRAHTTGGEGGAATGGPKWFEVDSGSGLKLRFGYTTDSRLEGMGSAVRIWALSQVIDTNDNLMEFAYETDPVLGSIRPSQITYTGTTSQSGTRSAVFEYENRPDVYDGYIGGAPVTMDKRLKAIRTKNGASEVSSYLLTYDDSSSIAGRSLLTSVTRCGGAGGTECLRPHQFSYSAGGAGWSAATATGKTAGQYEHALLIDQSGNGRADLVVAEGGDWQIHRAEGAGWFGTTAADAAPAYEYESVQTLDYNGDGLTDLMVPVLSPYSWRVLESTQNGLTETTAINDACGNPEDSIAADVNADGLDDFVCTYTFGVGVHLNTGGGFSPSVQAFATSGEDLSGQEFRSVSAGVGSGGTAGFDFNGDGRGDLLIRTTRTTNYQCDGEPGCVAPPVTTEYWTTLVSTSSESVPSFSKYQTLGKTSEIGSLRPLDLNGDGLTDLAYIRGNTWRVRLSTGVGFLSETDTTRSAVLPNETRVADYDGDGRSDLVYRAVNWTVLRSDGTGFEAPLDTGVTPSGWLQYSRVADVDGDGDAELVVAQGSAGNESWYIYGHNGAPADLLSGVDDNYGNVVLPAYSLLTDPAVYSKGIADVPPGFAYNYRAYQGPSPVVREYTASDGAGGTYDVALSYQGAVVHNRGRGFQGFEKVVSTETRVNPDSQVATELSSESVNHITYPFSGLTKTETLRQSSGQPISVMQRIYGQSLLNAGKSLHVFLETESTETREVGGPDDGALILQATSDLTYDGFGVVTSSVATVTGPSGGTWTTTTTNTPQAPGASWCVGLLQSTSTTVSGPQGTSTQSQSFSPDAAHCRYDGQTANQATLNGFTSPSVTSSYSYDSWGNRNSVTVSSEGKSRTVSIGFGAEGYFPTSVTNALGHQANNAWDADFGVLSSASDPNGTTVSYTLDAFGRVLYEDTDAGTRVEITRSFCSGGCAATARYKVTTRETAVPSGRTGAMAEVEYDGQGRPVREITYLQGGAKSIQDRVYDEFGRLWKTSAPYLAGDTAFWSVYRYDEIGKILELKEPASAAPYVEATHTWSYSIQPAFGRRITYVDPLGRTSSRLYNELGQIREVVDAASNLTAYSYDVLGNLDQVVDALGRVVTLTHDARGQRRILNDPASGQWGYSFNGLGELSSQTDAKGQSYSFTYDALGRLTSRSGPEGVTSWTFDTDAGAGLGRLDSVISPGFQRNYDYDSFGRIVDVAETLDGASYVTSMTYDNLSRIETITYPESIDDPVPAPAGLDVEGGYHTDGSYGLTWSSVAGQDISYELYESTSPDFSDESQVTVTPGATSHQISGKSEGTYYYRVRACDPFYCSAHTEGDEPARVTIPPAMPTGLTLPGGFDNDGTYTIAWTGEAGSYFRLYEADNANFTGQTQVYGGTASSTTATGRADGSYYYRVQACHPENTTGCSAYKTSASPVQVTRPPPTPTSIAIPTAYDVDGTYTVSWQGEAGAIFKLYEATNSSFTGQSLAYSGTSLSNALSGKANGSYYYRVRACNAVNPASCSGYRTGGNAAQVTLPPAAPNSVTVPGGYDNDGAYTISWTGPGGASFQLYESNSSGFSPQTLVYSGTSTSKYLSGKGDGKYYYRVRACNSVNTSACSAYVAGAGYVHVTRPPGTPTSLTVPSGYDTDGAYTVSWTGEAGAYFRLYEANNSSFSGQTQTYGGTNLSKAFAGKPSGNYYYRLRACDPVNTSSCSGYVAGASAVQVTLPPAVPSSISVPGGYDTDGAYTVSWQGAAGAHFKLYEASNSSFSGQTLIYSGTSLSKAVSGKSNGSYYYRVRACNATNTSACSGYRSAANPATVTRPPSLPAWISVPSGTSTTGSYSVSWASQAGVVFKLYESTSASFSSQTQVYSGSGSSKSFSGKSSGTYYYRVRACNATNTNACSGYRTGSNGAVVLRPPAMPASITRSTSFSTSGNYYIYWGASPGGNVSRYELQQSTNSTSNWINVYSGTALSKYFSGRPTNDYYYRVRACNASGCSSYRGNVRVIVERIGGGGGGGGGGGMPNAPHTGGTLFTLEGSQPDSTSDPVSGPRLAALRKKQATLEAHFAGKAGRTIGGAGSGYRYGIQYHYDDWGQLEKVTETEDPTVEIWRSQGMDAFGNVSQARLGNGVDVQRVLDAATGQLRSIQSGPGLSSTVQNLGYTWNTVGNLSQRRDDNLGQVEDFAYDNLNRLTAATVAGGPVMSLSYDAVGNLKTKSLTGNVDPASDYALSFLHSPDGARLTQIQGDLAATIVTDANGNITSRGSLSVSWTPFNKPQSITRNGETSSFKYGPERARYRQDYTEAGETVTRFYVGRLFEAVHRNSVTEYHHHILAAGEVVATHIRRSNQAHATHWVLKDHQGSVDVVLDENRQEVGRTTFDAFGGRRSAGWDGLPEPGTIVGGVREFTSRGYTGHEHLDGVEVIHMNGRVYDPLIGRFLSPDPIVARPFSSQGWNRFAYVSNNPLSRIDPSGFRASIMPPTKCTGDCTGSNAGYIPGGSGSGGQGGSSEGQGLRDETIRQGVARILSVAAASASGPAVGAMVNWILSQAGPSSGAIGYSMPSLSGGGQANGAVNRDSGNEVGGAGQARNRERAESVVFGATIQGATFPSPLLGIGPKVSGGFFVTSGAQQDFGFFFSVGGMIGTGAWMGGEVGAVDGGWNQISGWSDSVDVGLGPFGASIGTDNMSFLMAVTEGIDFRRVRYKGGKGYLLARSRSRTFVMSYQSVMSSIRSGGEWMKRQYCDLSGGCR